MNSKERILTTLNHEEPDRVPIHTSLIDSASVLQGYGVDTESGTGLAQGRSVETLKKISKYPLWRKLAKTTINSRSTAEKTTKASVDLYKKIGIDLMVMPVCLFPIGKSAGFGVTKFGVNTPYYSNYSDEYGRIFHLYHNEDSELALVNYIGGMFDSETGDLDEVMAKYDKWAPLDASIKSRFYMYEEATEHSEQVDGAYVIPGLGAFLEVVWQTFGFETYVKLLFEHPDFIERVTQERADFTREILEIMVEKYNIEAAWVWDDQAYKTGPFLRPQQYKKLVYPRMKGLVSFCHKNGVKVMLHTCGNINRILDDIIDTGIDGLNPLEPAASMDAFQFKKDHGDKVTIIGNVDTIHLLAKGTPQEVADYTKKLIKHCAPGGGLIVASGHSINPAVPFENYRAMVDTVHEYGVYPLKIAD
ncbi:MAG: uroporphyrinogen decarboxylase family protein [Candidatus Hodarchaeales archaeon]|jgi:uroporphyrinogen decarboxylase